jgi:glutaredoxin
LRAAARAIASRPPSGGGRDEAAAEAAAEAVRRLTLYTRPGCHLCEQALATIEQARSRLPAFALELRDISTDERLHDAYFERIPVVEVDGEELCEHFLDEEALQEALGGAHER